MKMRTLAAFIFAPLVPVILSASVMLVMGGVAGAMFTVAFGLPYSYAASWTGGAIAHVVLSKIGLTSRFYYILSFSFVGAGIYFFDVFRRSPRVGTLDFMLWTPTNEPGLLSFICACGAAVGYSVWKVARPDLPLDELGEV